MTTRHIFTCYDTLQIHVLFFKYPVTKQNKEENNAGIPTGPLNTRNGLPLRWCGSEVSCYKLAVRPNIYHQKRCHVP